MTTESVALLDTSVVIDFPADRVARHCKAAAVSSISLAELAYGLHTPDPMVNLLRQRRYNWILGTFEPIVFDADCAGIYGALCATVRLSGRDPRPRRFDMLIASVAVNHRMPLLTRNGEDFVGLHQALRVIEI